jgi:DNA-binding response OmpR family regulator
MEAPISMRASANRGTGPADPGSPLLYVVDDDEATSALLRDVAEEAGWEARAFPRLAPLRVALRERRPAFLILDDELPDGRGGDFARTLKRDPSMSDVPMLVCTAARPMRQAEIGDWAPVVAKPFDLSQIERFLEDAARTARGGDASHRSAG